MGDCQATVQCEAEKVCVFDLCPGLTSGRLVSLLIPVGVVCGCGTVQSRVGNNLHNKGWLGQETDTDTKIIVNIYLVLHSCPLIIYI